MTDTGSQNFEKSGNKAPCGDGVIAIIETAVAFARVKDNLKYFSPQGILSYHFQVMTMPAMRFVTNLKISHKE